jgi:hypothetical protein
MPEFYAGGRTPMLYDSAERITNHRSGLALTESTYMLFGISLLLIVLLRKRAFNISWEIWCLLLSSICLFIIANLVLLNLFEPSRYVRISLSVFLIIFVSVNVNRIIDRIKTIWVRRAGIIMFLAAVSVFYLPRMEGDSTDRYEDQRLYKFLQTLPKNVLIAAPPELSDNIPIFSKRKVLVMRELAVPYYPGYYNIIKLRLYDFYDAYYSDSPNQVYEFCLKYNVTHIVVDDWYYGKEYLEHESFYEPFYSHVRGIVSQNRGFVLQKVPDAKKLFIGNGYFVIGCDSQTLLTLK